MTCRCTRPGGQCVCGFPRMRCAGSLPDCPRCGMPATHPPVQQHVDALTGRSVIAYCGID